MSDPNKDTAAKMAVAQALLGRTTGASKGWQPPPKPKIKIKPKGGLKPTGFELNKTWKF